MYGYIFPFIFVQRMADPARIKPEFPKATSSGKDEQSTPEDTERASTSGSGSNETKDSSGQLKPKEEKNVSRRAAYMPLMNVTWMKRKHCWACIKGYFLNMYRNGSCVITFQKFLYSRLSSCGLFRY